VALSLSLHEAVPFYPKRVVVVIFLVSHRLVFSGNCTPFPAFPPPIRDLRFSVSFHETGNDSARLLPSFMISYFDSFSSSPRFFSSSIS